MLGSKLHPDNCQRPPVPQRSGAAGLRDAPRGRGSPRDRGRPPRNAEGGCLGDATGLATDDGIKGGKVVAAPTSGPEPALRTMLWKGRVSTLRVQIT